MTGKNPIKVRVNDEETIILRNLAANVGDGGLILEIGSAWGHSCVNMAEASSESVQIITIDPWSLIPKGEWAEREKLFLKNIEPFRNRIEIVKDFSQNVDVKNILKGRRIDLLFIDGDHHQNAVRDDYLNYHPFVKKNGFIVFHDYGLLAGVTKAVDMYVNRELWDYRVEERLWIGRRR